MKEKDSQEVEMELFEEDTAQYKNRLRQQASKSTLKVGVE